MKDSKSGTYHCQRIKKQRFLATVCWLDEREEMMEELKGRGCSSGKVIKAETELLALRTDRKADFSYITGEKVTGLCENLYWGQCGERS